MFRSFFAALAFAYEILSLAVLGVRPRCCSHVVPGSIKGAGTVWICTRPPLRR
ncbi:hypothetical protein ABIE45_005584 [Methylobacterium sp. OAE515]